MFKLPPLPYGYGDLAPVLSHETLELHHGKHHRAYVDKLNQLVEEKSMEAASLEDLVTHATGELFNNAAQAWNHDFYWHCLTPDGSAPPSGTFAAAIDADFGSFAALKRRFAAAAVEQFGSGWAWLVLGSHGTLDIVTTSNADTPFRQGTLVLLACDVWEHAYYVDYRNARQEYLHAFWEIVDWQAVNRHFEQADANTEALGHQRPSLQGARDKRKGVPHE